MTGRLIGLDPGERRIGVAVSDPSRTIASPVRHIDRRSEDVAEALRDICDEFEPDGFVVGLPVSLDGSEGPSAIAARAFAVLVEEATNLPVTLQDERFTSHTAEQALLSGGLSRKERKERRDQVAAAVMLQTYLDGQANDDDER